MLGVTHILKIRRRPNINFLWRFWLTVNCLEVIYQSAVFLIIANMEISNHHCQSKHVKCSFLALLLDSWFARRDKVLKYTWKKSCFPLNSYIRFGKKFRECLEVFFILLKFWLCPHRPMTHIPTSLQTPPLPSHNPPPHTSLYEFCSCSII